MEDGTCYNWKHNIVLCRVRKEKWKSYYLRKLNHQFVLF